MGVWAVTKESLRDDHRAIRRWLIEAENALKANDLKKYEDLMFQIESLASASRWAATGGE